MDRSFKASINVLYTSKPNVPDECFTEYHYNTNNVLRHALTAGT
jgi:hypothetical protein